jgi:DNA mismatch repair protein MutH
MRKLIESTLVSLDGVIGSPDRWSPFDEESRQSAKQELENYDALVLGRVTYEFLAVLVHTHLEQRRPGVGLIATHGK